MYMLVSPAKALDETPFNLPYPATESVFLSESQRLIDGLKRLAPDQVADLMKLSEKLAQLNFDRFQQWALPMGSNAKPALWMFKGDVYQGLQAKTLSETQVTYLQNHLGILSGLYGVLRPQDNMLPYRLEMGTKFANQKGKDLYAFWGDSITQAVNQRLAESGSETLVNLASNEYFKSVKKQSLNGRLITPIFKDWKNGQYKIISFYAKKARGLMARYAADHHVELAEDLKNFDYEGYGFKANLSSETDWVFTRKQTD